MFARVREERFEVPHFTFHIALYAEAAVVALVDNHLVALGRGHRHFAALKRTYQHVGVEHGLCRGVGGEADEDGSLADDGLQLALVL